MNAKVASPEIKHYCAHMPTKTTKRTRSILIWSERTFENAFGGCSELGGGVWNADRQGGWIERTPVGSFDTCNMYYVNTLYSLRYGLRRQMPSIFPTTEVIILLYDRSSTALCYCHTAFQHTLRWTNDHTAEYYYLCCRKYSRRLPS